MIIELIIAFLLGILAGAFTGLFPGIHINLVSTFIISSLAFLLTLTSPLSLAVFIVSMSITHIFLDFIPSIYLGAPEESSSLAILPGHELLLEGKGHEAVLYALYGCLYAVIFSILFSPVLIYFLPKIYPFIQRMMGFILILGSIFLISKESNSKLWASIIFILSGFLGLSTFNLNLSQPLLPLLSGLFGSSTLIYSITQKTKIPEQKIENPIIDKRELVKPALLTSLISPICSFLPGLGSSQAAILSTEFIKPTKKQFLFSLGAVNIILMILSFSALYSINKARTGSAAAIQEILTLTKIDLFIISISILLVSILSFFLAKKVSFIFAKNIAKINYTKLSYLILIIISIAVIFFSGFLGFLVFLASTTLGLLAIYAETRKGHLMGCLLIPSILYYLPFI
jgi:putative membrane protein